MLQVVNALLIMALGVLGCIGYFYLSNFTLDWIFPARGKKASRNINFANIIRPWLFLGPALFVLVLYLIYPVFSSIYLSMHDSTGDTFTGLDNYRWLLQDNKFWESMRNNALWLIIVPSFSTVFGLLAAALTDRVRWGNFAKSLIFMPMAISFIGASVIWKFIYEYSGAVPIR